MLTAPRPDLLATSNEQILGSRLEQLENRLEGASTPDPEALRRRIERLRGVLIWTQETQYHQRLTDAHEHLRDLNADVDALTLQHEAYVRVRQAAVHSYVGYQPRIDDLRIRVAAAREHLKVLMARQGHMLELVAIRELKVRRERLEVYQNQARFAFADSYDRAVKAQAQVQ
jgi:chromosome segregation ATPase